jgi:pimeloyl-ACP methyl ester carboxylesterase
MDMLSKMFMLPTAEQFATPKEMGLDGKPVEFAKSDGTVLRGWIIRSDKPLESDKTPIRMVMICPGNAANISVFMQYAKIFADSGLHVFMFDYQGYGKSDGVPGFATLTDDVVTAYQFITTQEEVPVTPESLGVFGVSLGSTLSMYLAARHPIGALAVEDLFSPAEMLDKFTSNRELGMMAKLSINMVRETIVPQVDPLVNLTKINCPIFYMHGEFDSFLPPASSQKAHAATKSPSKIWIMKDTGHAPESLEIHDREFAWQLQNFFTDPESLKTQPKIEWKSEALKGLSEDKVSFSTSVSVTCMESSFVEISLMDEKNNSLIVRRNCWLSAKLKLKTDFNPKYVSAVRCKYAIKVDEKSWRPDLSKLSAELAAFKGFQRKWGQHINDYFVSRRQNDSANQAGNKHQDELFNSVSSMLPDAESVHQHIRPYYALTLVSTMQLVKSPSPEVLFSTQERLLEYLPKVPEKHYRLGNAWFRLGFKESGVSACLADMAASLLDRREPGDEARAREIFRLHVRMSEEEWTPVTADNLNEIKSSEHLIRMRKEHLRRLSIQRSK